MAISRVQSTRRRRGSAVVSLPGQTNYQMDLHVLGSGDLGEQPGPAAALAKLCSRIIRLHSYGAVTAILLG